MRNLACAAIALALTASAAAAQDQGLTKEDVVKLVKAGISDDVVVAKIEQSKASFKLSADEIAQMKKDGVSDRVLQAMLGQGLPGGEGNLAVSNSSHRTVKVTLNERDGIIDFSLTTGAGLEPGGRQEFKAKGEEIRVAVGGVPTRHTAKLPATLLVRGAEMEYLDVVTLTIDDAGGRTVMVLHSVGKQIEAHRVHPPVQDEMHEIYGPRFAYLPFAVDNILLGAGIGAIIGHQRGHRTEGALIGAAAGALLDIMTWRFR